MNPPLRTAVALLGALAMLLLLHAPARADEAAVRAASDALVQAWNRNDQAAWTALLTDDAWYSPTADGYGRGNNRDTLPGYFQVTARERHLAWRIVRLRPLADGLVGVVLVQTASMLPKTGDTYAMVFTSDPSYARWRREGDGRWRLAYFTSDKGSALAAMQKDEAPSPGVAAAASAAAPAAPAVRSPPKPRTLGEPPAEYTAFWGRLTQGCNVCHARPPTLPSSTNASRIVAAGAAAADAAALRQAMAPRPGFTDQMGPLVADPALTDAVLDALRRYFVDVRDGAAPAAVVFDAPRAVRDIALHNERASRDTPVTLAELRIEGPFALDGAKSRCRVGARIEGQSTCRVVLRAAARAAPGATGRLLWRFAPTPGLEPAPRSVALRIDS
jgi:ketosteroid isomerase-like protein